MEKQTFIEFVAEMISNENFINRSIEDKKHMYQQLQEIYDQRLASEYQAGHHLGWLEGMRRASEIIKNK